MSRIMVVDDEEDLLSLYGEMIGIIGHEVTDASFNGEEAIIKFREMLEKPDIVILDHRMPVRNGLETAKEILSLEPKQKILFVSADNSVRRSAFEIGIVDFIDKPFTLKTFRDSVERMIKE